MYGGVVCILPLSLSATCSLLLTLLKASYIHMIHTYLQVRYRSNGREGVFP